MPVRQHVGDLGRARGRRLLVDLCREAEAARLAAGLSYAAVGRSSRLSGWQVGRILRGESTSVSLVRLAEILAIVGLDLVARVYPADRRVRDAAHLALLARLRRELSPEVRWRVEVPVVARTDGPPDRRAWDATISGASWTVAVEAETRVSDVQSLERRLTLKQRDGRLTVVLLVLNDTEHHRRIVRDGLLVAAFPGTARAALRALRRGRPPEASSILLL